MVWDRAGEWFAGSRVGVGGGVKGGGVVSLGWDGWSLMVDGVQRGRGGTWAQGEEEGGGPTVC